jgi:CheY-like chemotaxis protein
MLLVVEDESISRYAFARLLTKEGYDVKEAANGLEALNLLKTHRFDLVIPDLAMPEMNGLTLVDRLRFNGHTHRSFLSQLISHYREQKQS